jgi:hypothetical protein
VASNGLTESMDDSKKIVGNVQVQEAKDATIIGVQIQYGPSVPEIAEGFRKALADRPTEEDVRLQTHKSVFTVPPLPSHHINRSNLLQILAGWLTAPVEPGVMRIEALHGVGGVGKSTVAKALCYDPSVRKHFDGVLWGELGVDPNPSEIITRWLSALGEVNFQFTSMADASERLRLRLSDRRFLLILDDVSG